VAFINYKKVELLNLQNTNGCKIQEKTKFPPALENARNIGKVRISSNFLCLPHKEKLQKKTHT
jgi:hypothetical protein